MFNSLLGSKASWTCLVEGKLEQRSWLTIPPFDPLSATNHLPIIHNRKIIWRNLRETYPRCFAKESIRLSSKLSTIYRESTCYGHVPCPVLYPGSFWRRSNSACKVGCREGARRDCLWAACGANKVIKPSTEKRQQLFEPTPFSRENAPDVMWHHDFAVPARQDMTLWHHSPWH